MGILDVQTNLWVLFHIDRHVHGHGVRVPQYCNMDQARSVHHKNHPHHFSSLCYSHSQGHARAPSLSHHILSHIQLQPLSAF